MKSIVTAFVLTALIALPVAAQEAPAPHRSPRTPVTRQSLGEGREQTPPSREVQGQAAIIDGEKLRINDTDLRLFGIVPPQLSASFGPQARAQLDTLAGAQSISCQIRDRDRDGRLLATCRNAGGADMALELLKHGLAVTARGSLSGTELAASYAAAEQTAQAQKLGLWSVAAAAPAAAPVAAPAPAPQPQVKPDVTAEADAKKDDKAADKSAPRADSKPSPQETQNQAKIAADLLAQQQAQARLDDTAWETSKDEGFFERYQILISGLLMLGTALSVIGAITLHKRKDRLEETKAVAAALRGELMAARSVCVGRAKSITSDAEDRTTIWPRIRSTLYQAYVGRLGLLGAELARQVASLYGQSSDYAALYHPTTGTAPHEVTKKQALDTLAKRIEEVLPRLAEIERTGLIPATPLVHSPRRTADATAALVATPYATGSDTPASFLTETHAAPVPQPPMSAAMRTTLALWDSMRSFIQNHGAETVVEPQPQPMPIDPQVAEYAAMIEADMARYQYSETLEPLDITPQKKKQG